MLGAFSMVNVLWILLVLISGAITGWLAGLIMHSEGGTIWNIIIGIIGGILGRLLFAIIGIHVSGWISSVIGACVLIFLIRKVVKFTK